MTVGAEETLIGLRMEEVNVLFPIPEEFGVYGDKITVRLIDQKTNKLHLMVKPTTEFSKIKNILCEIVGIPPASVMLLYNGYAIGAEETPI